MFEWLIRTETPAPDTLDEGYLARLQRHVGADAMGELIDDGMLELADKLDHLAEQEGTDDIKHVAAVCHDIAGAAGNLGLTALTRVAVEANRQALGDTSPAPDDLVQLVVACRVPAMEALTQFRAGCSISARASPDADQPDDAPAADQTAEQP